MGCWLAEASHAENVSCAALRAVAGELESHDAPEGLSRRAREAAEAALGHGAMLEAMALRWGVRPLRPKVVPIAARSLEALAAENAAQGCVRVTWSALEAHYQALAARDPVIRRAMTRIAADGSRHAELSWTVDMWARRRLQRAARERVERARVQAVADVLEALRAHRDRVLCVEAGLPTGKTARGLVAALSEALWSRPLPS